MHSDDEVILKIGKIFKEKYLNPDSNANNLKDVSDGGNKNNPVDDKKLDEAKRDEKDNVGGGGGDDPKSQ